MKRYKKYSFLDEYMIYRRIASMNQGHKIISADAQRRVITCYLNMDHTNKYNVMEPFIQIINRHVIQLSEDEIVRNNYILRTLLSFIIDQMRETDQLFEYLYTDLFYGGSYYDRLKVEKPDEYDVDVLFTLPARDKLGYRFADCDKPGSVVIKFPETVDFFRRGMRRIPDYGVRGIHTLINHEHYFSTEKFMIWLHRVLSTSLSEFKIPIRYKYEIAIEDMHLQVKIRRKGPAFTIRIKEPNHNFINVDFVPCFKFGNEYWLPNGFKDHGNFGYTKKSFFIVPKNPPAGPPLLNFRYWRLSFQEQEREIISSKKTLKPAIKLLKRIKNKYNHNCIASYFLKTIGMWQVKEKPNNFWENSLSYVFMVLIKAYRECLENKKIRYFWYPKKNLIEGVDVKEVYIRINKIIEDIDNNLDDGITVAKYILTHNEYDNFKEKYKDIV